MGLRKEFIVTLKSLAGLSAPKLWAAMAVWMSLLTTNIQKVKELEQMISCYCLLNPWCWEVTMGNMLSLNISPLPSKNIFCQCAQITFLIQWVLYFWVYEFSSFLIKGQYKIYFSPFHRSVKYNAYTKRGYKIHFTTQGRQTLRDSLLSVLVQPYLIQRLAVIRSAGYHLANYCMFWPEKKKSHS